MFRTTAMATIVAAFLSTSAFASASIDTDKSVAKNASDGYSILARRGRGADDPAGDDRGGRGGRGGGRGADDPAGDDRGGNRGGRGHSLDTDNTIANGASDGLMILARRGRGADDPAGDDRGGRGGRGGGRGADDPAGDDRGGNRGGRG